jgi:membrane protein
MLRHLPLRLSDLAANIVRAARVKRLGLIAAGAAFYILLALFPLLSAAFAIYGLLADRSALGGELVALQAYLPPGVFDAVARQASKLLAADPAKLGFGLGISLLIALWSSVRAALAMMTSLNTAYGRQRRTARRVLVAATLAFGGFLLLLLSLFTIALPGILAASASPSWSVAAVRIFRWPALALLVIVAFGLLYHYAPNLERGRWRLLEPGALIATGCSIGSTAALSLILRHFDAVGAIFGSLTGGIALLFWIYATVWGLCLGGLLQTISRDKAAR